MYDISLVFFLLFCNFAHFLPQKYFIYGPRKKLLQTQKVLDVVSDFPGWFLFLTTGTSPRHSLTASHSQAPWRAPCSPLIAIHSYCHWIPVPPTPLAPRSPPQSLWLQLAPGRLVILSVRTGKWACQGLLLSLGKVQIWTQFHWHFMAPSIKKERDAWFFVCLFVYKGLLGRETLFRWVSDAQDHKDFTSWDKMESQDVFLRVGPGQGQITCLRVSPTCQQFYTGSGLGHCTVRSIATPVISERVSGEGQLQICKTF